MSRASFFVAHGLAIMVLMGCWIGGVASLIAVLSGYADPWLLLLAALFIWFGYTSVDNLWRWFSRIPEDQLDLTTDAFILKNEKIFYSEVLLINCRSIITHKRQNFVKAGRDFTVLAEITDRQGKIYKMRASQGAVTWFGPTYGEDQCKRLITKLRTGHQHTSALWTTE